MLPRLNGNGSLKKNRASTSVPFAQVGEKDDFRVGRHGQVIAHLGKNLIGAVLHSVNAVIGEPQRPVYLGIPKQ